MKPGRDFRRRGGLPSVRRDEFGYRGWSLPVRAVYPGQPAR
jgi:hypothetical protein